ncbi:hydrogenase expression/formation protein HypD [Verrucomicrobiia bacterium DG1235]|nr:hydrogenase expression/formation protein HypD [Verrucomicrobiae bacterium DG1235]
MKHLSEYRNPDRVRKIAQAIAETVTRPWTIMEICGGQTHNIARFGLEELLPKSISLAHGPGCPVCVTPVSLIDKSIAIARQPDVILCSFGDMLRVPGSRQDLFAARADGADVRIVYSPLDALALAKRNPDKQVVFFAVGFETTAPANAMAVFQAAEKRVSNFSILVSHVLVPPAIHALLSDPENRVQGFLAAGHVCAITGESEYWPIAKKYGIPIVVTGFEPVDIMLGLQRCITLLEEGRAVVENQYARIVPPDGNAPALRLIREIFEVSDREWRGLGTIPQSGFTLRKSYQEFDATRRFSIPDIPSRESPDCIAGKVLRGISTPMQCPLFETKCTPTRPQGAPMVSSEGACAAYYRYRRVQTAS